MCRSPAALEFGALLHAMSHVQSAGSCHETFHFPVAHRQRQSIGVLTGSLRFEGMTDTKKPDMGRASLKGLHKELG